MKIKRIGVLVLMCCCVLVSKAQYNISIEIENTKTDTLLMGYFWHGGTYALDTAINKKNKFVFKDKTKKLEDGIYFFSNMDGRYCEFLIDSDQDIRFRTKDENWIKNMEVKGSEREKVYFEYLQKSDSLAGVYSKIVNGREKIQKEEYDTKIKTLTEENDRLKQEFIKNNPNHLLTKILTCTQPLKMPKFDTIYKKDGSVDTLETQNRGFCWYKKHYFDNVDFSCGALLNTYKQVFMDYYNRYWDNVMKYEKADSILYYASYWIDKATDKKMFEFLVRDITTRYLQSGVMGHDKVYVGMVEKYLKTGKYTALSPSDMQTNIERADKWKNLLIGQTVPDIACPEGGEETPWHHLGELENKYKILVFWSIDCGHCTTEIPHLNDFYKEYGKTYNIGIFAVHTEGEIENRDEFLKKNDIHWVSVNGLFANLDWREYFDIEKTPVVYVLDKKNKILAKNIPIDNLKKVFEVLENGGFDL
jgi:thiol-disulfide isomerase/thioredoxin